MQQIFKDHFDDFINQYDEKYASTYGNYRIDRIKEVVEEFLKCGDFTKGVAQVKCQNKECNHDYFVPLSCLSFYLCPSCHQKRTLLFGEQMANEVLLKLPHRQFVFTIPKCLRPYFVHNRTLFSDVSHLIFDLIREYYDEVAGKPISSALILSHQTAGDFVRIHPHWHGILIEGWSLRFAPLLARASGAALMWMENLFIYPGLHGRAADEVCDQPISSTKQMTELFRRKVIKLVGSKLPARSCNLSILKKTN